MADGQPPLSPKSRFALHNDIKLLMHSFGDVSSPLQETVELVETIVREQTHGLMCQLADMCNLRETSSIGLEEFLLLFRRNKVKLQRFLSYLKSKDLKTSLSKDVEVSGALDVGKGKKYKMAAQFLEDIDSANSLSDALEGNLLDVTKQRRLLRQDVMSRTMNEDQYMKFHESRQVNLGKRLKSPKMRDWLFGDIERQYKISPPTLELVAYCMHEIVSELVDSAIMIKIESRPSTDPLDRLKPLQNAVNPDWLTQRIMLTSELSALSLLSSLNAAQNNQQSSDLMVTHNALTPADIREVLRRRAEKTTPLHPQVKQASGITSTLLCL